MRSILKIFLKIYVLTIITSCLSDKGKNIPDVSHIDGDVNVMRFEKALFALDSINIRQGLDQLKQAYPDFINVYFDNIVANAENPNETWEETARLFLGSPALQSLYDTCMLVYPDLKEFEQEMASVFQYYQYYFPEKKVPKIVTYISEYALGAFTLEDDVLGVGLDFYLGKTHKGYNPMIFPDYIKMSMNEEHMAAKTTETLANYLAGTPQGNRMVDFMIHNGKILYLMDILMPHTPDHIKLSYTEVQAKWCKENEKQIWAYLLGEDLLYASKLRDIQKYVNHSPHSPGMPAEAPGRTANWIGWQVIKSFMKRNPEVTVPQMLAIKDAQELMDKAKYKPKR